MFSVKADDANMQRLITELDRFGSHALPQAAADTLNQLASDTSDHAKNNLGARFTLRNEFTFRSIVFQKVKQRKEIGSMYSITGARQEYLKEQETGFTRPDAVIPTAETAGQGSGRRTLPKMNQNRLKKIKLKQTSLPAKATRTPKQALLVQVYMAVKTNRRQLYLTRAHGMNRSGIYEVRGGFIGSRGWPIGAKLRMLYDTSKGQTRSEPRPWLVPASEVAMSREYDTFESALLRQIKMQGLFKDRRR
jgi:hypothetical protein